MSRFAFVCAFIAIAGCNGNAARHTTRTITTVSWDAQHHTVRSSRVVPVTSGSEVTIASISVDPDCTSGDLILSDEPLIHLHNRFIIDPSSDLVCITPPGDTEDMLIDSVGWPSGIQAFDSGSQPGGFFAKRSDAGPAAICDTGFTPHQLRNANHCVQTAMGIEFDAPGATPSCTGGSQRCLGNILEHCDSDGQWQITQDCAASHLGCDPVYPACSGPLVCSIAISCPPRLICVEGHCK
jgi:hypothetical protein